MLLAPEREKKEKTQFKKKKKKKKRKGKERKGKNKKEKKKERKIPNCKKIREMNNNDRMVITFQPDNEPSICVSVFPTIQKRKS